MDFTTGQKRAEIEARVADLYRRNQYFFSHLKQVTKSEGELKSKVAERFGHIVDQAIRETLPSAKPATLKDMRRVMLAMHPREAAGMLTNLGQPTPQPQLV